MNLKKIPYYLFLISLTLGASLIIGLLSFGGLYVLWPNLIFASVAFILSVAYEGEIYLQNIKGALSKLSNPQSLTIEFAKNFLKNYFPHHYPHQERPLFFLEYEYELHQLHSFEHQALTASRRAKKQEIEQKLKQLEKKFSKIIQLREFALHTLSKDDRELFAFLQHYRLATPRHKQSHLSLTEEFQTQLNERKKFNGGIQYFSGLSAIFMSVGTSYLLVETFAIIPFLLTLQIAAPLMIIPMAIVSGIAYGLLTYNTLTNIIIHDRIRGRIRKLREDYEKNGLTWQNAFMITTSAVLGTLAIVLTICTAGTWWTILKNTPPLFRWMKKIPSVILGVTIPFITGTASLAFNLENSTESLEMFDAAIEEKKHWKTDWSNLKYHFKQQWRRENTLQRLNPFRLILITVIFPLRFVLFLGHLMSIGVTADRVPGLSKVFSAFLGVLSELFEDVHYFMKNSRHQHDTQSLVEERLAGADHNHDADLPTRILNILASPLHILSSVWDYLSSQLNQNKEHRLHLKHIFERNEITPRIPLPLSSKDNSQTINKSLQTTNSIEVETKNPVEKISKYFSTAQKRQEDSVLSNCPCCPSPSFSIYQHMTNKTQKIESHLAMSKVQTLGEKIEFISNEQAHFDRIVTRTMPNTPASLRAKSKIQPNHPFFINMEYCTFISTPANPPENQPTADGIKGV